MSTKDFQVVLKSRSEVDFTLTDHEGHIISSCFPGEKSRIPGGCYLYSINNHPLHDSATLLKDVSHTMDSEESYPLTLVFKNEPDKKEKQKLILPMPDNFLGEIPALTDEEIQGYIKLAKTWVQGLLDASTSNKGFNYVCTRENVDIYQGHDPEKKIQLVRGQTKIKCSVEEMRAFMIAPTTDSFRRLFHMIDVHFQDGLLLHKFPKGYKHPDVPFYAIKWGIMGMNPSPIWLRDVCWLEYGDVVLDENGKQMGFGVASSIERPECPTMENYKLVRADMMCSGYVFREIPDEPDCMEVTYIVQADPKGWLPKWAVNMFAWQEALNLARIRKNAEGIHQAKEKMSEHNRNGAAVQGVLIPHGKKYDIDIEVTGDLSVLSFGFSTLSNDIGFYIRGLSTDVSWSEDARYQADKSPISGQVNLVRGQYELVFDNSYSWFTSKQVYYWFSVTEG